MSPFFQTYNSNNNSVYYDYDTKKEREKCEIRYSHAIHSHMKYVGVVYNCSARSKGTI